MKKAISPVFFALVVACFFLPFFSVSCAGGAQLGQNLGDLGVSPEEADLEEEVTGYEIVTGDAEAKFTQEAQQQPPAGEIPGVPQQPTGQVDLGTTQIFAIAAAAIAVLGIVLALMPGRSGGTLALALGVIGAIVLFLTSTQFKGAIEDAIGAQVAGFIEVKNELGFWLALLAFALAALGGVLVLLTGGRRAPAAATVSGFGPPPPTAPPAAPPPTAPPAAPPPEAGPPGGPPPAQPPG